MGRAAAVRAATKSKTDLKKAKTNAAQAKEAQNFPGVLRNSTYSTVLLTYSTVTTELTAK